MATLSASILSADLAHLADQVRLVEPFADTIHIDGLRFGPGGGPPSVVQVDRGAVGPRDLADSGTDVA